MSGRKLDIWRQKQKRGAKGEEMKEGTYIGISMIPRVSGNEANAMLVVMMGSKQRLPSKRL